MDVGGGGGGGGIFFDIMCVFNKSAAFEKLSGL